MTRIRLYGVLSLLLGAAVFGGLWMSTRQAPVFEGPWVYGHAGARFTITEYADLECPYCKEYFPWLKNWVDTHADVNLVWNHLPLQMHEPAAGREARLAECVGAKAGSSGFWTVAGMIYRQTSSNGTGIQGGDLNASAVTDPALLLAIKSCSAAALTFSGRVDLQAAKAKAAGVEATPTVIITDNLTQKSIKLVGMSGSDALLSAIDWLASSGSPSGQTSAAR